MNFRVSGFGFRVICAIVLTGLAVWLASAASIQETAAADQRETRNPKLETPTVGLEGRVEVVLPGTRLEARPVEHKAKIILRVAETRPRGDSLFYDLRYVGLVPGNYDLRNHLVRTDGSATNDLPPIPVSIAPLLPANHNGQLIEEPVSALGRLAGYKILMIAAAVVWAALLVPLVWRRRTKVLSESPPPSEPTLAERLRPLVEQAAHGTLSRDGQAQLERMLLNHWRQRLGLEGLSMAEALVRLREHSEAGELLRALESWLHRPPGTATVDVNAMLAPYRNPPANAPVPAADAAR